MTVVQGGILEIAGQPLKTLVETKLLGIQEESESTGLEWVVWTFKVETIDGKLGLEGADWIVNDTSFSNASSSITRYGSSWRHVHFRMCRLNRLSIARGKGQLMVHRVWLNFQNTSCFVDLGINRRWPIWFRRGLLGGRNVARLRQLCMQIRCEKRASSTDRACRRKNNNQSLWIPQLACLVIMEVISPVQPDINVVICDDTQESV